MNIPALIKNKKTLVMFSIIIELLIIGILGNLLLWVTSQLKAVNPINYAYCKR
jgi:hypothetical protein